MAGTHRHRDIWVPLGIGLVLLAAGTPIVVWTVQRTAAGVGVSLWPNPFIAASMVVFIAGVLLLVAVMKGWPLPGGLMPVQADTVSKDDTDEQVGHECLVLAQSMWELLSNAKRDEPGYAVEAAVEDFQPPTVLAAHRASVTAHRQHDNRTLALFLERFGVRLSGVLQELIDRGHMTQEEARSLWWKTQTVHWLGEIPQTLAAKGRQIGGRL